MISRAHHRLKAHERSNYATLNVVILLKKYLSSFLIRSKVIIIDVNIGENSADINILHILRLYTHSPALFSNDISQTLTIVWGASPIKVFEFLKNLEEATVIGLDYLLHESPCRLLI